MEVVVQAYLLETLVLPEFVGSTIREAGATGPTPSFTSPCGAS